MTSYIQQYPFEINLTQSFLSALVFSTDFNELARQNKITKQILEAFIQKKLGLRTMAVRPPSITDILPVKRQTEEPRQGQEEDIQEEQEPQEGQDYVEDDSLQSVESEQIDSVYNEGMYNYLLY